MKNDEEDSSDSNFESPKNEVKTNKKPEPILIDANGNKSKPKEKVPTNTVKQPLTRPQKALKGFLLIAIAIVLGIFSDDVDESFWIFCSLSIFLFVYGWSTILQAMTTTKDMSNTEAIGTTVVVFGFIIFAFIAWIIYILSQGI